MGSLNDVIQAALFDTILKFNKKELYMNGLS